MLAFSDFLRAYCEFSGTPKLRGLNDLMLKYDNVNIVPNKKINIILRKIFNIIDLSFENI